MKDIRNKVHFFDTLHTDDFGNYIWMACGKLRMGKINHTTKKQKVTCKNCKRTKLFRGVK